MFSKSAFGGKCLRHGGIVKPNFSNDERDLDHSGMLMHVHNASLRALAPTGTYVQALSPGSDKTRRTLRIVVLQHA